MTLLPKLRFYRCYFSGDKVFYLAVQRLTVRASGKHQIIGRHYLSLFAY